MSTSIVHYRPSRALHWLDDAADCHLKSASRHTKEAIKIPISGEINVAARMRSATKALIDIGRSAYGEIAVLRNESPEYLLYDDTLIEVRNGRSESIPYKDIREINHKEHEFSVQYSDKTLIIKPFAYITSGIAKAPIGWEREGHEVRFEVLIEELSARCGIPVS